MVDPRLDLNEDEPQIVEEDPLDVLGEDVRMEAYRNSLLKSDILMKSSSIIIGGEEGLQDDDAQAKCDEESIAFGVMYFPRMRVQRTDKFNCDTRF